MPTNYQERRRAAALEQQQSARDRALGAARGITSPIPPDQPTQPPGNPPAPPEAGPQGCGLAGCGDAGQLLRQHWASQLMQPEWLVEVPSRLQADWYVLPRPEGMRCLVIASQGQTVARQRDGHVVDRWASPLPSGGQGPRGGEESVLDCIYNEQNATYYVIGGSVVEQMLCVTEWIPLCSRAGAGAQRPSIVLILSIDVLSCRHADVEGPESSGLHYRVSFLLDAYQAQRGHAAHRPPATLPPHAPVCATPAVPSHSRRVNSCLPGPGPLHTRRVVLGSPADGLRIGAHPFGVAVERCSMQPLFH